MRVFLLVTLYFLGLVRLSAQTRVIDYPAMLNWPVISSESISNDGKFLAYKLTIGKESSSLIVQAIDTSWVMRIPHVSGDPEFSEFSENSRWIACKLSGDSIGLIDLLKGSLKYFLAEDNFYLSGGDDGQWIAFRNHNGEDGLTLTNLVSGENMQYANVKNYLFSNNGQVLLVQKQLTKDSIQKDVVALHNLASGEERVICTADEADGFIFSQSGTKLSFYITKKVGDHALTALEYYQSGMDSAKVIVNSPLSGYKDMGIAKKEPYFSKEGDKLFFYIANEYKERLGLNAEDGSKVEVLTQLDDSLQFERKRDNSYLAVIDLSDTQGKIQRLQEVFDIACGISKGGNGNYALAATRHIIASFMDYRWRPTAVPDFYLISVKDGSRKLLIKKSISSPHFSPMGKYVIWFDPEQKNWFAYNIARSSLQNITSSIHALLCVDESPDYPAPEGIAGWFSNDEAVLIYDRRDIWKIDPDGKKSPINITGGYGRKNDICLRILEFNKEGRTSFQNNDKLLIAAFNFKNKKNGFFKISLNRCCELESLNMESRFYFFPGIGSGANLTGESTVFLPIKAKNASVYLVKRMSASEYPNLFVTANFRNFKDVTRLGPQKQYNWYQPELCHWKFPQGWDGEGILYKPQNFDPEKKYPVIFYYYEKNADMLNFFFDPALSDGVINIPWFVSKGYLVIMPNIYYDFKDPGKGVYNSIMSAARYIATKPWVDSHRMGLMGHSFGGWETNYMITHTSEFTAAAVGSGNTDIIRHYEDELPGGNYYEIGQGRMGVTLWTDTKAYIRNSPIFLANKVTTPVLIMHNKNDGNIHYEQGRQWYYALSRLHKKAWMLSYEGEGHTIDNEKNQLDYSIRLSQFFDYYLKNLPPPKWMTEGGTSLELDYSGKKP